MKYMCVYAGSNPGVRPDYREAAQELGKELVARGLGLVYGGGQVGLMGVVADAVLSAGGEVIGVMPKALFPSEVAHQGITLYEVDGLHERKAKMSSIASGFIALPGGFGTYDELFESITWAQLGIHEKPIGVLNVSGYFDPLLALIKHTVEEGFIRPHYANLMIARERPGELLDSFETFKPLQQRSKWAEIPDE
jgi:uncharacterized protein (TIGR00730 family)